MQTETRQDRNHRFATARMHELRRQEVARLGANDGRGADHFAAALEPGINFFDTADVYSVGVSEEITGRWLGEMATREDIVVATKVHGPMAPGPNRAGLSRKHILEACDAHCAVSRWTTSTCTRSIARIATPLEETLEALDSLVRAGKVRYLGASSMAAWQFTKALTPQKENGWHRFVSMQNHYNLVYREEEREMNPLCREGVGLIPWSPLARGFLAGNREKRRSGETARAKADNFAKKMYFGEGDFLVPARSRSSPGRVASRPRKLRARGFFRRPASPPRSSGPRSRNIRRKRSTRWSSNSARRRPPRSKSLIGRTRFWGIRSPTAADARALIGTAANPAMAEGPYDGT